MATRAICAFAQPSQRRALSGAETIGLPTPIPTEQGPAILKRGTRIGRRTARRIGEVSKQQLQLQVGLVLRLPSQQKRESATRSNMFLCTLATFAT